MLNANELHLYQMQKTHMPYTLQDVKTMTGDSENDLESEFTNFLLEYAKRGLSKMRLSDFVDNYYPDFQNENLAKTTFYLTVYQTLISLLVMGKYDWGFDLSHLIKLENGQRLNDIWVKW